jgi:hypothetical protein
VNRKKTATQTSAQACKTTTSETTDANSMLWFCKPALKSVLPFFYDSRNALFSFWNYKDPHKTLTKTIFLPHVMVFTNTNSENTSIQIEQISSWVGKGFLFNDEVEKGIISWFSITSKTFLHMFFDMKSGFLFKIITQKGKEDQIPYGTTNQICGDKIKFTLIDKETCKYTLEDASQKNKAEFTTITAYYFGTSHVHDQSRLEAYADFIYRVQKFKRKRGSTVRVEKCEQKTDHGSTKY